MKASAAFMSLFQCTLGMSDNLVVKVHYGFGSRNRSKEYSVTEFDFLGYTFKGIWIKDRLGRVQQNFLPFVSRKSAKSFREKIPI